MSRDRRDPIPFTLISFRIADYHLRPALVQMELKAAAREAVADVWARTRTGSSKFHQRDTGDGLLVLVPADVPKTRVVSDYVREIRLWLGDYNSRRNQDGRLRFRAALHVGDVIVNDAGFSGAAPVVAEQLSDASVLRAVLDSDERTNLALVVSEPLFLDTVAGRHRGLETTEFQQTTVDTASFRGVVWINPVTSITRAPTENPAEESLRSTEISRAVQPPVAQKVVVNKIRGGVHGESVNLGFMD